MPSNLNFWKYTTHHNVIIICKRMAWPNIIYGNTIFITNTNIVFNICLLHKIAPLVFLICLDLNVHLSVCRQFKLWSYEKVLNCMKITNKRRKMIIYSRQNSPSSEPSGQSWRPLQNAAVGLQVTPSPHRDMCDGHFTSLWPATTNPKSINN